MNAAEDFTRLTVAVMTPGFIADGPVDAQVGLGGDGFRKRSLGLCATGQDRLDSSARGVRMSEGFDVLADAFHLGGECNVAVEIENMDLEPRSLGIQALELGADLVVAADGQRVEHAALDGRGRQIGVVLGLALQDSGLGADIAENDQTEDQDDDRQQGQHDLGPEMMPDGGE